MDKKERWQQYYAVHGERPRAKHREYNAKNRDKRRAYREARIEEVREYFRKYRIANREKILALKRDGSLRRKYGLSASDYKKLRGQQNGLCAICGLSGDKLCVDHDHTTGEIRGLVHGTCNSGIGQLRDSAEIVEKAAIYLRKTQPKPFAAEKYREDCGF